MNTKISSLIFCALALLVTVLFITSLLKEAAPIKDVDEENDTPNTPIQKNEDEDDQDTNHDENPINTLLSPVYQAKDSLEAFIERQAYGTNKEYKASLPILVNEMRAAATTLNSLETPDTAAASLYAFLAEKFSLFQEKSLKEETKFNTFVSSEILTFLKSIDLLGEFSQDYCPKLDTSVNGSLTLTFVSLYQQKYAEDKNLFSVTLGGSLVLGDDSTSRFSALYGNNPSSLLSGVSSIFGSDHISVVSLVNPLVHPSSVISAAEGVLNPIKGSTDYVKSILKAGSIEGVALTGVHMMDYGIDGYSYTTNSLGDIQYASDYGIGSIAKMTVGNQVIAMISYNWTSHDDSASDITTYKSTLSNDITQAKKDAAIVIVYINWTGQKSAANSHNGYYTSNLSVFQTNVSRAAMDAGATLVVGATPHGYQTIEYYGNRYTAFSLGDLSYSATQEASSAQYGFLLNIRFAVDATGKVSIDSFTLFPYHNKQISGDTTTYTPKLVFDGAAKDLVLTDMNNKEKIERSRYSISFLRDHFIYIAK